MKTLQKNAFKVKLFERAMGFADWLARLPNKLTPPPFRLIQIGSAYWQSRALYVATILGLADELAKGERSCQQIATALSLHEDNLYRLMRMLASIGVFKEHNHRMFSNSPLSEPLRRDHPQSIRAMILLHNSPEMTRPWNDNLEQAVRQGEVPFEGCNGEELFGYLSSHPEYDDLFSRAMDAVEGITGTDYLHDFDWSCFGRIIDVGGSQGGKTLSILKQNPQLEALVLDRPQVVAGAREYWRKRADMQEPLGRVEFVGGDMLEAIPPAKDKKDIYLLMAIFHALSDEMAVRVLQNLHQAMGGHSATAVIADAVVAEAGIDPNHAAFDMQMLIGTRGRERTRSEWEGLLSTGGFSIAEIVNIRTFAKFIVIKPLPDGGVR